MKKNYQSELFNDSQEILTLLQEIDDATMKLEQMIEQSRPSIMGETYLTDAELSELLNVSRRTLQKWRAEGLVEYIQLGGGKVIYSSSAIEALLTRNVFPAWAV